MKEIWKAIKSNITSAITQLDQPVERTNREMVYGAVACIAAGIVVGMLLSPKKNVTVGSNNSGNGAQLAQPRQDEDAEK